MSHLKINQNLSFGLFLRFVPTKKYLCINVVVGQTSLFVQATKIIIIIIFVVN